jgi:hypothetical protein
LLLVVVLLKLRMPARQPQGALQGILLVTAPESRLGAPEPAVGRATTSASCCYCRANVIENNRCCAGSCTHIKRRANTGGPIQ